MLGKDCLNTHTCKFCKLQQVIGSVGLLVISIQANKLVVPLVEAVEGHFEIAIDGL